jgi:hypothetical protein
MFVKPARYPVSFPSLLFTATCLQCIDRVLHREREAGAIRIVVGDRMRLDSGCAEQDVGGQFLSLLGMSTCYPFADVHPFLHAMHTSADCHHRRGNMNVTTLSAPDSRRDVAVLQPDVRKHWPPAVLLQGLFHSLSTMNLVVVHCMAVQCELPANFLSL